MPVMQMLEIVLVILAGVLLLILFAVSPAIGRGIAKLRIQDYFAYRSCHGSHQYRSVAARAVHS